VVHIFARIPFSDPFALDSNGIGIEKKIGDVNLLSPHWRIYHLLAAIKRDPIPEGFPVPKNSNRFVKYWKMTRWYFQSGNWKTLRIGANGHRMSVP